MVAQDISSSSVGDMSTAVSNYSVDTATTDGASDQKLTEWTNVNFPKYFGYYKNIPELHSTINTKTKYVTGKGVKADKKTMKILNSWPGWGKDTINQLIQNLVRTYYVGGDSFSEIIKNDSGKIINLKPLDPSTITITVNEKGMLQGYIQNAKVEGKEPHPIATENMFHLANNRFADEIHGQSIISPIENIILTRNEAISDMKIVFHRYVKPLWIWQLDTDDTTKIAAFKAKADKTVANSENIYIPKGAAEAERVSVPQFSTLDPLPWIEAQTDYFYQATNTPDVVVGSAKQTVEASAKILILGFEQSVRDDQLFVMENFKSQLGLEIELEYPTPIEAELISDEKKDGSNVQAN
ncbi:hypothetical protein LCGC14_1204270 [marine sediment metagenome]|uniref:Uncharacterized protein n=1 Tax=marine sediment metagenome TaxID=412755 RepID=A0A0F9PKR9_9ZZZZ